MASRRKRADLVHLNLRLPKDRHRELKQTAKRNNTSLHAELLRRLAYDDDASDRDIKLDWIAHTIQAIWGKLNRADANGQQAQTGPAPQNGPAPQERTSESRDG